MRNRDGGYEPRLRALRLPAVLLAISLAAAACSGDNKSSSSDAVTSPVTAARVDTTTPPLTTAPGSKTSTPAPFEVKNVWVLPARQDPPPSMKTEQDCAENFWKDEDGKRQPPYKADPLIVRVDGSCNAPLSEDSVGIYFTPHQRGAAPIVVHNGDALGVECVFGGKDPEWIQDVRGPAYGSDTWVGVVTADGKAGLVPEVNIGYVDDATLRSC